MSTGTYVITTRASGTVLTAAIYNADHQNHVTNQNPQGTGAYSDNAAQMQTQTSPGTVGAESLATSLAGELERIRFQIARMTSRAFWYDTPAQMGMVLLATQTVTNTNNVVISFASYGTTYRRLRLEFGDLISNTGADQDLGFRVRQSAITISTAGFYRWQRQVYADGSVWGGGGATSDTQMYILAIGNLFSDATVEVMSPNVGRRSILTSRLDRFATSGAIQTVLGVGGHQGNSTAIDGVEIIGSSGNWSANIAIYGMTK
jgi:hypothetical protein